MKIELKEVSSKRDLKSFIYFPFWLYSGNKYWVPPIIKDEKNAFDRAKNPNFKTGDARLYLVYKDRRIAGRVAVIANHAELENERKIRFGWLDFEDDRAVSALLFDAIEESARELNATTIEGPVGFTILDRAGMLIEGFKEEGTMSTWYNHPYYQRHIENWGAQSKQDWVEFSLSVPTKVPERISRAAALIKTKYNLSTDPISSKAELKSIAVDLLKLMGKTYGHLYNYTPLTEEQMLFYANNAINFIPLKNVLVLRNENEQLVAFALTMPSLVNAAKRAKGHFFPFGFLHFLWALKKNSKAELLLIGVDPEYQNKGLTALIFEKIITQFIAEGVKTVESNPEQIENKEIQTLWKDYECRPHKRRRVYQKVVS